MSKYIARYKDTNGVEQVRRFTASHNYHANKIAIGLAKSNNWRIVSVGRIV